MNPIRLETGTRHLLASCATCPTWRELRGTRPAALLAAATHMDLVHGDARAAGKLRERAQRDTPRPT